MALETELETYRAKLPELSQHEGKFALVHGATLIDVFGTYEDAIKEAYSRFKLEPFMIKQIHMIEQAQFVSRLAQ